MQVWAGQEHAKVGWVTLFKTASAVVFDAIDPTTLSPPRIFGTSQALTVLPSLYESFGHTTPKRRSTLILSDPSYSILVLGFQPSVPSEIIIGSPTVYRYPIAFLVNASKEGQSIGYRFKFGEQYLFRFSVLQFAENLYRVSDARFNVIAQYNRRITNSTEYLMHQKVAGLIAKAKEAYEEHRYSEAYSYASEAWRIERDVYFYARRTLEDASFAVPILAAFLIPFTVIGEKLLINASGRKKVISLVVFMAIIIAVFYLVHPGFRVAASPEMIIIGFSILTLILPIIFITFGGFFSAIKFVRTKMLGRHEIEVARVSLATWSFILGIENMRKRKFRTTLVLISILLMVIAFTNLASLGGIKVVRPTKVMGNPLYNGIYVRRSLWGASQPELSERLAEFLATKYKGQAVVAPRSWVYTDQATNTEGQFGFTLSYDNRSVILHAILGLTPNEVNVTGLDAFLGGNGTWFQPSQRYVCLLTSSVANTLGIREPGVTVYLFTRPLKVIGIIDDKFNVVELDGEQITPIMLNYPGKNPYNTHIKPSQTIIMPYRDVIDLGGQVASISMKVLNASETPKIAREVFDIITDLFIYSSYNNQTLLFTHASVVTAMGMEAQIVPFILLSLSIFSIMLGNVYERLREIGIYGALGLSPMHVGFMFFAEAVTYALIGGILGYVLAMVANVIVSAIYPGAVVQNMSSSAVIYALLISMLATIISSIYPFFKASKLVVPSLERKWRITTSPVGDNWSIPLPFYLASDEEVGGMLAFMREFFSAHTGESPPLFSVINMRFEEGELDGVPFKGIRAELRIAPYETGVHQIDRIIFRKTNERWGMLSLVTRLGGATRQWVKLNTRFTNELRKQLLLWRSMSPTERKRYIDMFKKMTEKK